jgi:hypothetical protein
MVFVKQKNWTKRQESPRWGFSAIQKEERVFCFFKQLYYSAKNKN